MTSTTTAYLAVSQNLSRYQAMTAAEPAVKTATAYYEANIGSVKSIQDLVGNYRLLSYALDAYGLGDQINAKGLITKVLEGGVSNPKSLANTLPNPQWKAFAAAFNFVDSGAASPSSASSVQTTTGDYVEQQLESDQGAQDVGRPACALFSARRADGHQRRRNSGRSRIFWKWPRRSWGSRLSAASDLQPQTLSELMPLSDLQDPAKLQQLTERFTAMYDYTYGPSSGASHGLTVDSGNSSSGASGAAAVLASIISSNGSVLEHALNAFTGAPSRRSRPRSCRACRGLRWAGSARRLRKGPRKRRALSETRCFRAPPMLDALQTTAPALRANDAESGPMRFTRAAVIAWRERRRDEAIKLMDEALRLRPDFAEALSMGGYMLSECGKPDAAMRFYRRALELDPSLVVAHVNLGKLLFRAGLFVEALASFAAATALAPHDADAWCSRAGALRELGRLEESVEAAKRALALRHDFAEAAINLGNALLKLDRSEEALASLSPGERGGALPGAGFVGSGAGAARPRPFLRGACGVRARRGARQPRGGRRQGLPHADARELRTGA